MRRLDQLIRYAATKNRFRVASGLIVKYYVFITVRIDV